GLLRSPARIVDLPARASAIGLQLRLRPQPAVLVVHRGLARGRGGRFGNRGVAVLVHGLGPDRLGISRGRLAGFALHVFSGFLVHEFSDAAAAFEIQRYSATRAPTASTTVTQRA